MKYDKLIFELKGLEENYSNMKKNKEKNKDFGTQ